MFHGFTAQFSEFSDVVACEAIKSNCEFVEKSMNIDIFAQYKNIRCHSKEKVLLIEGNILDEFLSG